MNTRLDQYSGKLTPAEIAVGMNAASANATRLYEDAKAMLDNKRYPTALCLAVLSIEESGKFRILRTLAVASDQKEQYSIWREYRSHKSKNVMWPIIEMYRRGARGLNDYKSLFSDESEHPAILDNLKQIGFYTDCLGKKHWSIPDQVIDSTLATQIVASANILLTQKHTTTREIELWIQYMKPVKSSSQEVAEAALLAWHHAMYKEGLIETHPAEMEKFIVTGMTRPNSE